MIIKYLVRCIILSLVGLCLYFAMHSTAQGMSAKNIMRSLGIFNKSRTLSQNRKNHFETPLDTTKPQKNGFQLHAFYECESETLLYDLDIAEVTESSLINSDMIKQDALLFSITIETIKAHIEIASKTYKMYGLDIRSKNFDLRYHDTNARELNFYPPKILAAYRDEIAKIVVPDAVRSVAYIYYVITPTIKPFMSKQEFELYEKILRALSFMDVLAYDKKRSIWHYNNLGEYKERFFKILDIIEERNLKQMGYSRKNPEFDKKVIIELTRINWVSYGLVRACPLVSIPQELSIDINTDDFYQIPASRDTFLVGLGFFARIQSLLKSYIHTNSKVITTKNIEDIELYFKFFSTYYKDVFTPEYDKISYSELQKSYLKTVCILSNNQEEECQTLKKDYKKSLPQSETSL